MPTRYLVVLSSAFCDTSVVQPLTSVLLAPGPEMSLTLATVAVSCRSLQLFQPSRIFSASLVAALSSSVVMTTSSSPKRLLLSDSR